MMNFLQRPIKSIPALFFFALAFVPTIASALDDNFLTTFLARVLIYSIAATALNIALGFGGLVSLGHALFIGLGMYSVALPAHFGVDNGWVQLIVCVISCSVIGAITGAVSLRTSGIAFIMITLAFAQMGYFVVVSLKQFGGDDGMAVAAPSDFFGLKLSTANNVYYFALALLVVLTVWIHKLRQSPFGMTLRAGRQNGRRVNSVGLALKNYQLTAYVLSAVFCGLAGMLLANLSAYASPSSMSWLVSGDLIVMVVLGGMGTVLGPIAGAFLFMGIEEILKTMTDNWMAIFGLLIVVIAMLGKAGVMGWFEVFSNSNVAERAHDRKANEGASV
jgi:branched-chain amino acid transport system permease protein